MIYSWFITLKTICIFFVVPSYANTSSVVPVSQLPAATSMPAAAPTEVIQVAAGAQQRACVNLNALPLAALSPGQKEVWLVGRVTSKTSQPENQNDCHTSNFGRDCQAMQITIELDQDGQTRKVTEYAYNVRFDNVAYREGKYLLLDSSYEVFREENMELKNFFNRDGAIVMASNPGQATAQVMEFAKVAQSKDGNWALFESCDQTLAFVVFRGELVANDPGKSFIEHYRQSIDDTLKLLNINTSNMVEVQLTFPFAISEIPNNQMPEPTSSPPVSYSPPVQLTTSVQPVIPPPPTLPTVYGSTSGPTQVQSSPAVIYGSSSNATPSPLTLPTPAPPPPTSSTVYGSTPPPIQVTSPPYVIYGPPLNATPPPPTRSPYSPPAPPPPLPPVVSSSGTSMPANQVQSSPTVIYGTAPPPSPQYSPSPPIVPMYAPPATVQPIPSYTPPPISVAPPSTPIISPLPSTVFVNAPPPSI